MALTEGSSSRKEYAPLKKEEKAMYSRFSAAMLRVVVAFAVVSVLGMGLAKAQYGHGSIVGWGQQVFGADLSAGFVAVAGGSAHSLGLRSDGSIVAWGSNYYARCDLPEPNTDFVAVAGGGRHSLGLKVDGSILAWGDNEYGQCDVPEPNTDFRAVAAGPHHCLALKYDGSIVAWGANEHSQCDVPPPRMAHCQLKVGWRLRCSYTTQPSFAEQSSRLPAGR